jgi:hypothetical protein
MDLVAAANSGFDSIRSNFEFTTTPSGSNLPSGSTKNTQVSLSPTSAGSATYDGTVKIAYNRLTVSAYLAGVTSNNTFSYTADAGNGKPVLSASMSASDTLAVINSLLGLGLPAGQTEFDSAQYAVTEVNSNQYTIALVAQSGAFLFTGNQTITINIPVQKTQTSSVVTNTEMDGLDAPSNSGS